MSSATSFTQKIVASFTALAASLVLLSAAASPVLPIA